MLYPLFDFEFILFAMVTEEARIWSSFRLCSVVELFWAAKLGSETCCYTSYIWDDTNWWGDHSAPTLRSLMTTPSVGQSKDHIRHLSQRTDGRLDFVTVDGRLLSASFLSLSEFGAKSARTACLTPNWRGRGPMSSYSLPMPCMQRRVGLHVDLVQLLLPAQRLSIRRKSVVQNPPKRVWICKMLKKSQIKKIPMKKTHWCNPILWMWKTGPDLREFLIERTERNRGVFLNSKKISYGSCFWTYTIIST
jgi:hypothetical protein